MREGLGKAGWVPISWLGGRGVREAGQGLGGGCKGFGSGGVGGSNACRIFVVSNAEEKWRFLKDARGRFPAELAWWTEQVQGRGQGRVGLAVRGGARASVAGG